MPTNSNETIDEIKNMRKKNESLDETLGKLKNEEKRIDMELKIMKKKEELERKIEYKNKIIAEQEKENSFYTDEPDEKGYIRLREEKWFREFEGLVVKLVEIEQAEIDGKLTEEEAKEAKKSVTKEIQKLKKIKGKVKARNAGNKIMRGMQKFLKGTRTASKVMAEIGDSFGQMGGQQSNDFKASSFENFFSDKPTAGSRKKSKKRRKKSKSKKKKTRRKRKKSSENSTGRSGVFEGINF